MLFIYYYLLLLHNVIKVKLSAVKKYIFRNGAI